MRHRFDRRTFLQTGAAVSLGGTLMAALRPERLQEASDILEQATVSGQVTAAVLHVSQRETTYTRAFGKGTSDESMFLLGSISKPIAMTALMSLYDQNRFQLDDPAKKYLPAFSSPGSDQVTLRHLLTHVSGLPDQLANNDSLRKSHAGLEVFVDHALRTPLQFPPGSRYQYSSMGILLAARIAEVISGTNIRELVENAVVKPLKMTRSAQGLGSFKIDDVVPCQTERAAPESGGGDPNAKDWDWNSPYWRSLGAPWGGTHASAPDVGRFLSEFLFRSGAAIKPETARQMVENHNPPGVTPRGLGFQVGTAAGSPGCSDKTFGHTGSTGTVCWADPVNQTLCVILTSLPARAVRPHPRDTASERIAARD